MLAMNEKGAAPDHFGYYRVAVSKNVRYSARNTHYGSLPENPMLPCASSFHARDPQQASEALPGA